MVNRIGIRLYLTVDAPSPDRDEGSNRLVVSAVTAALLIGVVTLAAARLRRP